MEDASRGGEITRLLKRHAAGDADALDRVVSLLYPELLGIAERQLRGQSVRDGLDTTSLVHEAYLRSVRPGEVDWQNRAHFFGVAALAMRRIVVDFARRRCTQKRGRGRRALTLDPARVAVDEQAEMILDLHDALEKLSTFNERLTRVVECRFFAGMTQDETAAALSISRSTAQRDWLRARAWLQKELADVDVTEPVAWRATGDGGA